MRKFDNIRGARYCGIGSDFRGMNWHMAELGHTGRAYRCDCFRAFRLGDGFLGPNGYPKKKEWQSRPENRSMRRYDIGQHVPGFNSSVRFGRFIRK